MYFVSSASVGDATLKSVSTFGQIPKKTILINSSDSNVTCMQYKFVTNISV